MTLRPSSTNLKWQLLLNALEKPSLMGSRGNSFLAGNAWFVDLSCILGWSLSPPLALVIWNAGGSLRDCSTFFSGSFAVLYNVSSAAYKRQVEIGCVNCFAGDDGGAHRPRSLIAAFVQKGDIPMANTPDRVSRCLGL